MTLNRKDVLAGALVADAAAMGLHWMYDQTQIQKLESGGDVLFRQPDATAYANQKGYFAHAAKRAGELSHYGESMRLVGQLAIDQPYNCAAHRQQFFASFGPCGSYIGYADKATKALIARIITDHENIQNASGMNDEQMPALCVIPGLYGARADLDTTVAAANVISTHDDVVAGVNAVFTCLESLRNGASVSESLSAGAAQAGTLSSLLNDALNLPNYQPLEAAEQFGLACPVRQSLPVTWHLLAHATNFESVIRDNIRCGGDSCGRTIVLGAIAGYVYGVPASLIEKMAGARVPIRLNHRTD